MISRKNAIAVLIAVLLIGCLVGASGIWLWEKKIRDNAMINDRYTQYDYSIRFIDQLHITPEQETNLKEILEDSRIKINACRIEMQSRMDAIRVDTNNRIAALLDKDQKSMFERLVREAEARRGSGHHGRGRESTVH